MPAWKQTVRIVNTIPQRRRLEQFRKKAPGALAGGVYAAATNLFTTAVRLAPSDTGWLRQSVWLQKPIAQPTGGFRFTGGFAASYALWVHERFARHAVGQWKFLQVAIDDHSKRFANTVARVTSALIASNQTIDSMPETHPTSPPLEPTNQAGLESLASRFRRRKSKKVRAKIAARQAANTRNNSTRPRP